MPSDNPLTPAAEHAPRRAFAVEVVRTLVEAGYKALWAGGCVRDLRLGRLPSDYDVATSATPDEVRKVFGRRRTRAVGESFGVVLVVGPRAAGQIEVATFRTEGPYADGRRPDSVSFATAEEDAQRRDFTINGMFYDPLAERVLDYVGGEQDLHAGIVRAIGDPFARMEEDKLRLLRAVRFTATLDFQLDPATADAVQRMALQLRVVSWERIAAELQRMLQHRHRRRAVQLMQQLGLLAQIVPELNAKIHTTPDADREQTLDTLHRLETTRFEPAMAVLLRGLLRDATRDDQPCDASEVATVCRRLKLSNDQRAAIVWLVEHEGALEGAETFPLARLKRLLSHPLASDLLTIARAETTVRGGASGAIRFVEDFLQRVPESERNPPPLVTGDDLVRGGIRPGPQFKLWLETVRDAQLNGEVTTRDEALDLLRNLAIRGDV